MLRTEKQATIDAIKGRFDRMVSAVFIDYKGLNVAAFFHMTYRVAWREHPIGNGVCQGPHTIPMTVVFCAGISSGG